MTHYEYDNLGRTPLDQDLRQRRLHALHRRTPRPERSNLYDALGRVYESRVYEVDPDDGTVGDYLPSSTWYDARGNVIKTATANGLFQKYAYDGLGRLVTSYTSFDTDETAYADADDVTGDTVIEQNQTWYDQAGQAVATATYRASARRHEHDRRARRRPTATPRPRSRGTTGWAAPSPRPTTAARTWIRA